MHRVPTVLTILSLILFGGCAQDPAAGTMSLGGGKSDGLGDGGVASADHQCQVKLVEALLRPLEAEAVDVEFEVDGDRNPVEHLGVGPALPALVTMAYHATYEPITAGALLDSVEVTGTILRDPTGEVRPVGDLTLSSFESALELRVVLNEDMVYLAHQAADPAAFVCESQR